MTQDPKAPSPQASTSHPETKKHVKPGLPDEKSSKASGKERDERGAHDKDGNEQQGKAAPR